MSTIEHALRTLRNSRGTKASESASALYVESGTMTQSLLLRDRKGTWSQSRLRSRPLLEVSLLGIPSTQWWRIVVIGLIAKTWESAWLVSSLVSSTKSSITLCRSKEKRPGSLTSRLIRTYRPLISFFSPSFQMCNAPSIRRKRSHLRWAELAVKNRNWMSSGWV